MAFLFADSFDHYATADLGKKWTTVFGCSISAGNGRHGSACMRQGSVNDQLRVALTPADNTIICGFTFKPGTGVFNRTFWGVLSPQFAAYQITMRMNPDGSVEVRRGTGTVIGTSAAGIVSSTTHTQLQVKCTFHTTTGYLEVRANGSTTPIITFTGNTSGTGATTWGGVQLGDANIEGGPFGVTWDFDDFWVLDGSGSNRNNFLGDCRVDAHFVTADGANTGSTPSTGSRFQCVDDTAPNGDTDYNTLTAAGQKDTFVLQDLLATGSAILAVQVLTAAEKTDAGVADLGPVLRIGGTDYEGSGTTQSTAYAYTRNTYEVSPATGLQFTEAEFNAMEAGYKRTA